MAICRMDRMARHEIWFRLGASDQYQPGGTRMKTVGTYEAKTHLPRLLTQVEQGETITITKRGRPVAVLSPARPIPERDVKALIAEFRAYSQEHARKHGALSRREIKEMTEEGRP
jgi:prevent-host-death family protein